MSSLPISSISSTPAWPAAPAHSTPARPPAAEFEAELPAPEAEPAPPTRPAHPGAAPAVNAYLSAGRAPEQPSIDVLAA